MGKRVGEVLHRLFGLDRLPKDFFVFKNEILIQIGKLTLINYLLERMYEVLVSNS